jgi:hypothetical protein
MPFELDDLQMSDGELVVSAVTGLIFFLGLHFYFWLKCRKRPRPSHDVEVSFASFAPLCEHSIAFVFPLFLASRAFA